MLDEIHEGDSKELLKQINSNSIDLVLTSPPYDNLRKYNSNFDFLSISQELHRVLKPGGVLVWIVNDSTSKGSESFSSLRQAIHFRDNLGFLAHDTMIYAKSNPLPLNHRRYEQCWEYMFVFSKIKPPNTFNPILVDVSTKIKPAPNKHHTKNYSMGQTTRGHKNKKIKSNIWTYSVGNNQSSKDHEAFQHPAIFPEQLAQDHILSWTNPHDFVLDPFCGSGTTCKMAKLLNRHFIGFDISKEYVNIAKNRLKIKKTTIS